MISSSCILSTVIQMQLQQIKQRMSSKQMIGGTHVVITLQEVEWVFEYYKINEYNHSVVPNSLIVSILNLLILTICLTMNFVFVQCLISLFKISNEKPDRNAR